MKIIIPSLKLLIIGLILNALSSILNICVMVHTRLGLSLTPQYLVCLSYNTGKAGTLCDTIEQKITEILRKKEKFN